MKSRYPWVQIANSPTANSRAPRFLFSTDRNRMKYGEERFVEVDPDAKTWRRVDE